MTSRYSIYIPIGITYKEYRAECFAAYIDTGAGTCLCKPSCFPNTYSQQLPPKGGRDISNNYIRLSEGVPEAKIIIGRFLVKTPPIYFHNTGVDILLGNNFLQLFKQVIFNHERNFLRLLTPCNHWILVFRLRQAFQRTTPLNFLPRSQRGDNNALITRKTDFETTPMLKIADTPFRYLSILFPSGSNSEYLSIMTKGMVIVHTIF